MWNRIKYLLSYFALVWCYFLVQKPVAMVFNAPENYSVADCLGVVWRGVVPDAATTGCLTVVPFLIVVASVWYRHMPFRKIMVPYYVVAMLPVTLAFVCGTGGYTAARVAVAVALTALMCGLLWAVTPRQLAKINMIGQQLTATLLALPVGALLCLVIRSGKVAADGNGGTVCSGLGRFVHLPAFNTASGLFSSPERPDDNNGEFRFYDEPRRAKLMEGLYTTGDGGTQYVLNTARPNILVIFMEGFGATMMERLGGEKGVAPNLGRLARHGVFFSRVFASSAGTDGGTVSTFSGYPGLPTLSLMKETALCQSLPGMARTLGKAGYTADFLYGGDINSGNMKGYLSAGGFGQFTSQDDFPTSDRSNGKGGVPDGIAFDRLYDMLAARAQDGKPWFTAFLTLSSRETSEVPFKKFGDARRNAFAYADHCIGEFMRRFRKSPQWKNTLVVLLSDHGTPYPKEDGRHSPRSYRIPMIWTGGAVRRSQKVEKIMNQTDLAATLLAQLGLRHDDFLFSRNVLSTGYTNPFAFYSFAGGFGFLDNSGVSVYDNASGKVLFNVAPEGDSLRVQKGKAILQTLYGNVDEMKGRRLK